MEFNNPQIIITYIGFDGMRSTFSQELPMCCHSCESEAIWAAMQSFMNATAEMIADKYEEEKTESQPTNGFADECEEDEYE